MVSHSRDFCDLGNRHFPAKDEQNLLKQQGEAAPFPRPGDADPADAMLVAFYPGHIGSDGALVLEEIEMLPTRFLEIMGLAQRSTHRTRVLRPSAGRQLKLQLGRISLKVKLGGNYLPRRCQTKPQCHDIVGIHRRFYTFLGISLNNNASAVKVQ